MKKGSNLIFNACLLSVISVGLHEVCATSAQVKMSVDMPAGAADTHETIATVGSMLSEQSVQIQQCKVCSWLDAHLQGTDVSIDAMKVIQSNPYDIATCYLIDHYLTNVKDMGSVRAIRSVLDSAILDVGRAESGATIEQTISAVLADITANDSQKYKYKTSKDITCKWVINEIALLHHLLYSVSNEDTVSVQRFKTNYYDVNTQLRGRCGSHKEIAIRAIRALNDSLDKAMKAAQSVKPDTHMSSEHVTTTTNVFIDDNGVAEATSPRVQQSSFSERSKTAKRRKGGAFFGCGMRSSATCVNRDNDSDKTLVVTSDSASRTASKTDNVMPNAQSLVLELRQILNRRTYEKDNLSTPELVHRERDVSHAHEQLKDMVRDDVKQGRPESYVERMSAGGVLESYAPSNIFSATETSYAGAKVYQDTPHHIMSSQSALISHDMLGSAQRGAAAMSGASRDAARRVSNGVGQHASGQVRSGNKIVQSQTVRPRLETKPAAMVMASFDTKQKLTKDQVDQIMQQIQECTADEQLKGLLQKLGLSDSEIQSIMNGDFALLRDIVEKEKIISKVKAIQDAKKKTKKIGKANTKKTSMSINSELKADNDEIGDESAAKDGQGRGKKDETLSNPVKIEKQAAGMSKKTSISTKQELQDSDNVDNDSDEHDMSVNVQDVSVKDSKSKQHLPSKKTSMSVSKIPQEDDDVDNRSEGESTSIGQQTEPKQVTKSKKTSLARKASMSVNQVSQHAEDIDGSSVKQAVSDKKQMQLMREGKSTKVSPKTKIDTQAKLESKTLQQYNTSIPVPKNAISPAQMSK